MLNFTTNDILIFDRLTIEFSIANHILRKGDVKLNDPNLYEIQHLISQQEYANARERMDLLKKKELAYTDEMAVLDASIYEALGNRENMFKAIRDGLQYSCSNYELYYMLGYYYLQSNVNQAYLCFQNALLYCSQADDAEIFAADLKKLEETGQILVRNTAIIIISYNACYMMQKNMECIRNTLLPGTYQVIVVDNASNDGVREWLKEQPDILLLENKENIGFAPACNQAVKMLRKMDIEQKDIFLLNNDTRLAPNALFWLRMGLYENERIGATGSLSNYAGNHQQLNIEFTLPGEYLDYGANKNIPDESPYEERIRLSGFAMLIKGHVWDETGGMDEDFAPGYFEDDDLSMKIAKAGYRLLLCRNSFIYHAGSQSFADRQDSDKILISHYHLFIEKYGFDILELAYPNVELIESIPFSKSDAFNLIQIGSGLGADLKYLHTAFPNANLVGIETNEKLYHISRKTELVFQNLASALETFQKPLFHILLIDPKERGRLNKTDLHVIKQLCLDNCILLPAKENETSVKLDQIKLVIWDLDQTFWSGILSEGSVTAQQATIALVKDMADCGIINSISSKNDESDALQALCRLKVKDYFVFNHINWENKGDQIQQKLKSMNLRPENVLFIDDDLRNLEEAKYYNPGLMTATPEVIDTLREYVKGLKRTDTQHKRLESYKLLETRRKEEIRALTKEQFLYESNIILEVHQDCLNEIDRIVELTARTNQLNFTKVRDDREKLYELLQDKSYQNGYVKVRDKFGDYGIVGFFCYNTENNRLRHFLFSCRVIGMGIAECIYQWLKTPEIEISEPVAVKLSDAIMTPWIHLEIVQEDSKTNSECSQPQNTNRIKVLLKGPCDMSAIAGYLSGGDITTEFNYVNDQGFITAGQNHSMHILQNAMLSREQISSLLEDVPFITPGDFETSIFSREYHVICYSLLPDCHAGLYRSKETGGYISFGSKNFNLTAPENMKGYIDGSIVNHAFPFTENIIAQFARNWDFVGTTSGEDLIHNLDYMYTHALGEPMFILLLGSEIEYEGENDEFADHANHHKEVNSLVKTYAKDKERIKLIEMTKYIHSQDDYEDSINHFSRNVYYQLAADVCTRINDQVEKIKKGNK